MVKLCHEIMHECCYGNYMRQKLNPQMWFSDFLQYDQNETIYCIHNVSESIKKSCPCSILRAFYFLSPKRNCCSILVAVQFILERNCAFSPQDGSRVALSLSSYTENQHDDRKPDVQRINQTRLFSPPTNYFILFPMYKYSFDFYKLCHGPVTVGSVFKSIRGTEGEWWRDWQTPHKTDT